MFPFKWLNNRRPKLSRMPADTRGFDGSPDQIIEEHQHDRINGNIVGTANFIYNLLGQSDDFVMRNIKIFSKYSAIICYLSSLTDESEINTEILKPLMSTFSQDENLSFNGDQLKQVIAEQVVYQSKFRWEDRLVSVVDAILSGRIVLLVEQVDEAFVMGSRRVAKRPIAQPKTEQVIQGPRDGFIEQLETNLALLRYRLPVPSFRINSIHIGRLTKSEVAICYIEGIVNPDLVEQVKSRLSEIDTDAIMDIGYIEQFIQDNHLSPFPQLQSTERPDKAVANLAEGRVVILVDGSPFALIVPSVFSQFFQTTEDYSSRSLQGSFVRLARVVALIFSLIFPALYVAVISFNPELIPTEFAVAVAGGRAGVPFPTVVEVLVMEISMEVLREATIRLPQQVGGALSIVGVLVIGEAAVAAGFASPITVVVIALTTIGSFATPEYTAAFALRMLRFPLIVLAGLFGLYGIMVGIILICNHLLSLKSFGVPYMSPVVPGDAQGMKDLIIRSTLWSMRRRPSFLHSPNRTRVSSVIPAEKYNPLDPANMRSRDRGDENGETT